MSTPLSTPVRQAKLGIASTKSLPLTTEYKKLLSEQHQRLWAKHQQDLDLIDDIRCYVKARLSIERDYASALSKLGKQHSIHIAKKFSLLNQCDQTASARHEASDEAIKSDPQLESEVSDSRLQKRLANNGLDEPDKPCSLYKVWSEHINRLLSTSNNRADQFKQLIMVVDKLKDIRSHKASIGRKCLDTHLKRIHEDVLVSMVDVEKARKLYYEDESQAKKARENEEKIKKRRSGLLTKFTDLQAKREKTSAQREANDIQSTQARNDYIMALAAANAHLQHYYQRDLNDFIHIIDDGVLDHCKIFMATLSECDINSLKDSLTHAQYWSKMINLTGSQRTNSIFLDCEQSLCLRDKCNLSFEPCNNDPIQSVSLEHNADYALQHEIDKWFTWFKKECRNLSQLMHQLEVCQRAFAEGKKSIELNGQTTEDLEPKIIELKQQIRKSEAAKLKAQARLKVIKEGGMQIEEWSAVESEIRADMARAQMEMDAKRAKELVRQDDSEEGRIVADQAEKQDKETGSYMFDGQAPDQGVKLEVSKDSDDSDADESIHNLASVSRSTSNIMQKQQNAMSGYSALTDPSLVWQDDYLGTWNSAQGGGGGGGGRSGGNYNVVVTDTYNGDANNNNTNQSTASNKPADETNRYDLLEASQAHNSRPNQTSTTVQSSSPLSAIVDGVQTSTSPYQGMVGEAYKSDYECDYNRNHMRSTASSAETYNNYKQQALANNQTDPLGKPASEFVEQTDYTQGHDAFIDDYGTVVNHDDAGVVVEQSDMLNRRVVALYAFDKTNADDLSFNENDTLRVIEVNDANWMKARNEATGEEGYIPTSYVKLLEVDDEGVDNKESIALNSSQAIGEGTVIRQELATNREPEVTWTNQDSHEPNEREVTPNLSHAYCRAVYDYEPEEGSCEEDGLPHLALMEGELMRIIDQGEDDGWWLVEKEETGIRGHVPSMLVEESDMNDNEENYDDEFNNELEGSVKAMPSFEPPVLQKSFEENESVDGENSEQPIDTNINAPAIATTTTKIEETSTKPTTNSSSLIPTAFIIIEPTPEVESRCIEESLNSASNEASNNNDEPEENKPIDRDIVHTTANKLPNDVSYSVINEEFVLEGPTRKPYHHQPEQVQHHETPTILEENFPEDQISDNAQNNDPCSKTPDGNYEPLSEVDSLDMPAPPSVIIESFEDDKQDVSNSFDGDQEGENDGYGLDGESDGEQPSTYVQKEIKHTGNVDVNPLLRHRAEEFSKQIIAEAIMLAPGADVGPSTSSADNV